MSAFLSALMTISFTNVEYVDSRMSYLFMTVAPITAAENHNNLLWKQNKQPAFFSAQATAAPATAPPAAGLGTPTQPPLTTPRQTPRRTGSRSEARAPALLLFVLPCVTKEDCSCNGAGGKKRKAKGRSQQVLIFIVASTRDIFFINKNQLEMSPKLFRYFFLLLRQLLRRNFTHL